MAKPKVAFYWCASCGGCEEAVVDLHEKILDVVGAVDIVLWPVALDFKRADVEAMPLAGQPGSIAVSFINGAVRMSEQLEWARLLRERSGLIVAFGACAHMGGIPGLANCTSREEILATKYLRSPSVENPQGALPQTRTTVDGQQGSPIAMNRDWGPLELPSFWPQVKPLDEVIDVDYYLPGCPPPADLILAAVGAILAGKLPAKGSVLAPVKALCETCPLNESKPEKMSIARFKRLATSSPDPATCFLAQGYVCMGPATRGGCGERCIRGNMPCWGCFGPPPQSLDQGAKFLGALASTLDSRTEQEVNAVADSLADPLGTFYKFSLAKSLLRRRANPPAEK